MSDNLLGGKNLTEVANDDAEQLPLKRAKGEDEDSNLNEDELRLDLEALTATDEDKQGITNLISSLLRVTALDISKIVDEIIRQSSMGSILKGVSDGSVFGVCSVLTSSDETPSETTDQLVEWLMTAAEEAGLSTSLDMESVNAIFENRKLATGKGVGILIYDRIVNLPVDTAIEHLSSLDAELSSDGRISYLVLIQRVYQDVSTGKMRFQLVEQELLEDFIFADFDISLDLKDYGMVFGEQDDGTLSEGYPYRRFVMFKTEDLKNYISACCREFGIPEAATD